MVLLGNLKLKGAEEEDIIWWGCGLGDGWLRSGS